MERSKILSLIGLYYSIKLISKAAIYSINGFKTFILPILWPSRHFTKEYGSWAIITGCTRGIGYCYARELAAKNMNLILIGRNADQLALMKDKFQTDFGIRVEIVLADFSLGTSVYRDIESCLEGKDIGILVNNVGAILPFPMYFNEMSEEQMMNMLKANILPVTLMTKVVLPLMEAKGRGALINIASVSGLSPQPLQTVYAATKGKLLHEML